MAVIGSTGGADLGVNSGSTGSRSVEDAAADSAPDRHSPNKDADRQQPPPALSPPPPQRSSPPQRQQQVPVAMVAVVDANLPHPGVHVLWPLFDPAAVHTKLQQHNSKDGGRGLGQAPPAVAANGVEQDLPDGRMMAAARRSDGAGSRKNGEDSGEGFRRNIRDLEELLSKLNPMAEEFVPTSLANHGRCPDGGVGGGDGENTSHFSGRHHPFDDRSNGSATGNGDRRKRSNYSQGKRRMNSRTSMAQRDDIIRRTVYVSDIDQHVTEEQLAALFVSCGQVVDCRICGDPNSVLRFAFIEFTEEEGARAALSLAGTMLGYYPVRVLPSKTAIAPVNPVFLPRTEDEREMCARTIYCTNIDKKVSQADVKLFFESICGEVYRLRLLGDYHHSTRIAFVEFVMAESAIAALNCSGVVLGSSPIRVSPSKTPVRPRAPRSFLH